MKPVEKEQKTKSGIVIPDTVKEKPQEDIVEAVGTGHILDNGTIQKLEPLNVLLRLVSHHNRGYRLVAD